MTWEQKRQQSYGYLEKYRDELPEDAYDRIVQTIGSQTIENMFSTEDGVKRLVMIERGDVPVDTLVSEYVDALKSSVVKSVQKNSLSDFDKELLSSNLVGARTINALFEIEGDIIEMKQQGLRKNPIHGNFDYEHLKSIHRELFKDVYVWAGYDRYDIGYRGMFRKGSSEFTNGGKLPKVALVLFGALKDENYFKGLDKEALVKSLASFSNGINILHPFREGNGRTQRLFMELLAKNTGYSLNLSSVSQSTMVQASIQGAKGNLKGFELMIKELLMPKK